MYQSLPVVAGTGVLGLTVARSPVAATPVGQGALAVTGVALGAYVVVALLLILIGTGIRLYSRFVAQ